MKHETDQPAELASFLSQMEDPVSASLDLALTGNDIRAATSLLEAAVTSYGSKINARSLHKFSRYARQLVGRSPEALECAYRFNSIDTPGAQWLAANILESLKRYDEASAILSSMDDVSWTEERAIRMHALAANLLRSGAFTEAWGPIKNAAQCAQSWQTLVAVDQLIAIARKSSEPPARAKRRISILGSGTLGFWAGTLRPALYSCGIDAELFIGEYEQYQQEILDPGSPLNAFHPEIVVLAPHARFLGLSDESPHPGETVQEIIGSFMALWKACQERFGASVIQFNFEVPEVDPLGRMSFVVPGGRGRLLQRLNLELCDAAQKANVAVFDVEQVAALYGKQKWNDATMWLASKRYPAAEALPFLSRHLAAVIRAICGLTSKCLALDLDGTLWGGIIGEDGLMGIRLGGDPEGEAFRSFQRYLRGLRLRGVPLAVCSKNNDDDARSVFRSHPESVLREDDFAVFLANWETKPDNLRRIAAMLNIGLDSLVFLDDNPVERNLVRKELPEVEVPELPDDPAWYAETLHRTYAFETISLTEEDRHRAESYRENAQRIEFASSTNIDDYLASLKMRVELRPFDEPNLPRIVQLINKTNQFNLTTRRTTAAEVLRWIGNRDCYTQFMRLKDRFGDNGITGVLVAFRKRDVFLIDNFLLSCRVLGRRVENLMLRALVTHASHCGATTLVGEYLPTAKNQQVRDFYERFGFELVSRHQDRIVYRLVLDKIAEEPAGFCEVDDQTGPTVVASDCKD